MANRERTKGREGEREVAAIWRKHGLSVRNLEGEGDHSITREPRIAADPVHTAHDRGDNLWLHLEVKRCETARPWAWYEQATREAPAGAVPVVAFRRNRSGWLALIALDDLARLLT